MSSSSVGEAVNNYYFDMITQIWSDHERPCLFVSSLRKAHVQHGFGNEGIEAYAAKWSPFGKAPCE